MSSYAEVPEHRLPTQKLAYMWEYQDSSAGHFIARFEHDHLFHVMGRGWYIEISGGDLGPFKTHAKAVAFLREIS